MNKTRPQAWVEVRVVHTGGDEPTFVFQGADQGGQRFKFDEHGAPLEGDILAVLADKPRKMPRYVTLLLLGYLARLAGNELERLGVEIRGSKVRVASLTQFVAFRGVQSAEDKLARAMKARFASDGVVRFERSDDDRHWFWLDVRDEPCSPDPSVVEAVVKWLDERRSSTARAPGSDDTREFLLPLLARVAGSIQKAFSPRQPGGVD